MFSLALCLCAVLPAVAAAAGSISGTVVAAATKAPIEGLEVCANPEDGQLGGCATTDADGEYTIALNPNDYTVKFDGEPLDYKTSWYDQKVLVGTDPVTGVDAEMVAYGRIEGVALEAGSEDPVEDVRVCVWGEVTVQVHCDWTDASGAYAITGLRPDEYVLEFLPEERLLPQFNDHQERYSEADLISVDLGDVLTGVDADLLPSARVEGTVRRADDQQPLPGVEICAWSTEQEEELRCAFAEPDGSYAIQGLYSGEYVVEFWPFSAKWTAQFWDHAARWDEAEPLWLTAGTTTTGIDADIAPEPLPLLLTPNPLVRSAAQSSSPPKPTPRRCRKGFQKKRVNGKVRCVRKAKPKRRHSSSTRGS